MVYRSTHRTPHAQGTRCLPHSDKPVPYPWEENAHFAHLQQVVNRGRRGGANKGAALTPINGRFRALESGSVNDLVRLEEFPHSVITEATCRLPRRGVYCLRGIMHDTVHCAPEP